MLGGQKGCLYTNLTALLALSTAPPQSSWLLPRVTDRVRSTFKEITLWKFIAINAHMKSKERSKIDILSSKLKELEEQASRRQEKN